MPRPIRPLPEPPTHPDTVRPIDHTLGAAEAKGVRCLACVRRCLLRPDQVGFCTAVVNWQGRLYSTAYGVVGEASVTPIETKPVYHFHPGARVLSLGGLGCNLRCAFCQNWELAFRSARTGGGLAAPNMAPEDVVRLVVEQGCQGIAWGHNEPSISPMYTYECARLARRAGLFTVFVTNGLLTPQALAFLGPWLDVYRVDVKSPDPEFYALVGGLSHVEAVLPLARAAAEEYGIHVEVVTNVMPGLNDRTDQLQRLADAIIVHLGPNVPWHLTTYIPYARMRDVPSTPPATLARARQVGHGAGLRFVYTDSEDDPSSADTACPGCGAIIVQRRPGQLTIQQLDSNGQCACCGTLLHIVFSTV